MHDSQEKIYNLKVFIFTSKPPETHQQTTLMYNLTICYTLGELRKSLLNSCLTTLAKLS